MKRALILVEGQTEERFVKDTLAPHLAALDLYVTPTLLTTKVVKNGRNFRGGVTSFDKFEADLRRLFGGAGQATLVTTMLDYYRLPDNFPGMADRPAAIDAFTRVRHVEQAISDHFRDGRLLPFLALHEFEAWVFSCPNTLPEVMAESVKQPQFAAICSTVETPEQINERPATIPLRVLFRYSLDIAKRCTVRRQPIASDFDSFANGARISVNGFRNSKNTQPRRREALRETEPAFIRLFCLSDLKRMLAYSNYGNGSGALAGSGWDGNPVSPAAAAFAEGDSAHCFVVSAGSGAGVCPATAAGFVGVAEGCAVRAAGGIVFRAAVDHGGGDETARTGWPDSLRNLYPQSGVDQAGVVEAFLPSGNFSALSAVCEFQGLGLRI